MKVPELVSKLETEVERELAESQNQRDARVEALWRKLDPQGAGELDYKGLQRGLTRIDHPMKNADEILQKIMDVVDKNGDGKIQYEEFRVFVEQAERHLLLLFRSIDTDQNGKLDKNELETAFRQAGLKVPRRRLEDFFADIDMNNDGSITFDEWRDFLLFMPTSEGNELQRVLSFYSSFVTLNAEGDSSVSGETLEGLGTTGFFLQTLFGSILRIANPGGRDKSFVGSPYPPAGSAPQVPATTLQSTQHHNAGSTSRRTTQQSSQHRATALQPHSATDVAPGPADSMELNVGTHVASSDTPSLDRLRETVAPLATTASVSGATGAMRSEEKKFLLTDLVPQPGYFAAGAIAGAASRTGTAPIDRLKVYLLVNTNVAGETAIGALTRGKPIIAMQNAVRPLNDAIKDLWRSGGIRTFFAGNGLNVLKIMPETATRFGTYEAMRRILAKAEGHDDPRAISSRSNFLAGGLAGIASQFLVYPLDTLKFRLQCETVEGGLTGNALLFQTAKKMWADGGLRATYRGLTMGLIGVFPYSAIDIGCVELLKRKYREYRSKKTGLHEEDCELGNVAMAAVGGASGALGATVVYPINVLRTRLQTQGTVMHRPTYTGIVDVATRTVKNEGLRGLYKGLVPNLLKVVPSISITWVVYENSKKLLGLH